MNENPPNACIAFNGMQRIASGPLPFVAAETKRLLDSGEHEAVLIFDASTSELIELDFRGSVADVLARLPAPALPEGKTEDAAPPEQPRKRGRPRLGVVAREATLLPRHWEWLGKQPGGASVALRKLVEEARRANADRDTARESRESTYRFMSAMAGGLENFEEAARALFAGKAEVFEAMLSTWPADVREHTLALAAPSFTTE